MLPSTINTITTTIFLQTRQLSPASMKSEIVQRYIMKLSEKFETERAREHAYRPTFEMLIHALDPALKILNDPSRSEHGNPDFIFLRGDITAGYTETKDIGVDLDKTEKSEQMQRYLGYSNLILTDYLEFRFFRNGSRHGESICVGAIENGKLVARIHPPRKSELYDELGEYFDFNEGDTFKIGKHTYLIDKIVNSRKLENGRSENGHILIRKQE